jgi:hypothetical protein
MIAYKLFLLTLCVSQAFALDYYSAMAAPVVAATEGFEKKELGADATTAAITPKSEVCFIICFLSKDNIFENPVLSNVLP